ncbi:MAG TPA: hypothetical protein VN959_10275, partial [Mycobacterium sp.]|nr:hypothetical protein [Mycobacterium sp.]
MTARWRAPALSTLTQEQRGQDAADCLGLVARGDYFAFGHATSTDTVTVDGFAVGALGLLIAVTWHSDNGT